MHHPSKRHPALRELPAGSLQSPNDYPDILSLDPPLWRELAGLRRKREIWLGSRRPTDLYPEGGCAPVDVILWVVARTGEVRAWSLVDPRHDPTAMMEVLGEAMLPPRGVDKPACRPSRLRVESPRLAAMLRQGLSGLDIKVEVSDKMAPLEQALSSLPLPTVDKRPLQG